jgi:hypothetical protein
MRSRTVRLLLAFIILSVAHVWAAASLKLGAVLPDWSEVRHGTVHSAATRLVEDYSAQVRHFCVIPEVFLLPSATSIEGGRDAYERFLPTASRQRLLVDASDQRVTMVVIPASGLEVMSVLALTGSGVLLILC